MHTQNDTSTGRTQWHAVWGFASTGAEVGILSTHASPEAAQAAVKAYLSRENNPAVGAWVRQEK